MIPSAGRHASHLRVVAIADSDSYVKWAAAMLGGVAAAEVELLLLRTPATVSAAQRRAAVSGSGLDEATISDLEFTDLSRRLALDPPDAVILAARGPVVRLLARAIAALEPRPVIVTGLPGMGIPARRAALDYRAQCDVFLVHSRRERDAYAQRAAQIGVPMAFALTTLPFLGDVAADAGRAPGGDLVFAAQTLVPREASQRARVLRMLVAAAEADPTRRVVLKLRAGKGERETHADPYPYPRLLARAGHVPANLVVSHAPMSQALDTAQGLVTVSSTAALEALVRGIPVIALDTYGISDSLLNIVFTGSGLLAGEDEVIGRRFRSPRGSWLADNYLHGRDADDAVEAISDLVLRRRCGVLEPKGVPTRTGGAVRDAWDRKRALGPADTSIAGYVALTIGMPLRTVVLGVNRLRRVVRPAS